MKLYPIPVLVPALYEHEDITRDLNSSLSQIFVNCFFLQERVDGPLSNPPNYLHGEFSVSIISQ